MYHLVIIYTTDWLRIFEIGKDRFDDSADLFYMRKELCKVVKIDK